jgi:hypothetical protein
MSGIPVLGSVILSGATSIVRKEHDYIQEHQIAGKDGGQIERVGSASTRWEIKGFLRESGADSDYQSLLALLGKNSNFAVPLFSSGYNLAVSGTNAYVESFGANWIPGYGYPRYDYTIKLVSTNPTQPAPTHSIAPPPSFVQVAIGQAGNKVSGSTFNMTISGITLGDSIIVAMSEEIFSAPDGIAGGDTVAISSNHGESVGLITGSTQAGNAGAFIYLLGNASVSGNYTLTATPTINGTEQNYEWALIEVSPAVGAKSSNQDANNVGAGTSWNLQANTISWAANQFVVVGYSLQLAGVARAQGVSITVTSGFTFVNFGNNAAFSLEYLNNPNQGQTAQTVPIAGNNAEWYGVAAVFG